MKRYNKLSYLLLGLLAGFLTACSSDDEHYYFPGDPLNKVFIRAVNTPDFKILQTPVASITDFDLAIYAGSRMKAPENITVTLGVDTSLVAEYNASHSTDYATIPPDFFTMAPLNIPADTVRSIDTVRVVLDQEKCKELTNEKGYLVPIKIAAISNGEMVPSTNFNVIYAIVNIEKDDNIKDSETPESSLVEDKSGWSASTTATLTSEQGSFADMFDDRDDTSWKISGAEDLPVIVDLGKEYDVTGFNAGKWYYYYRAAIDRGTTIYTSTDGKDWSEQGAKKNASSIISFYGAVKARYIKWTVKADPSWDGTLSASTEIGLFDVYAK